MSWDREEADAGSNEWTKEEIGVRMRLDQPDPVINGDVSHAVWYKSKREKNELGQVEVSSRASGNSSTDGTSPRRYR